MKMTIAAFSSRSATGDEPHLISAAKAASVSAPPEKSW